MENVQELVNKISEQKASEQPASPANIQELVNQISEKNVVPEDSGQNTELIEQQSEQKEKVVSEESKEIIAEKPKEEKEKRPRKEFKGLEKAKKEEVVYNNDPTLLSKAEALEQLLSRPDVKLLLSDDGKDFLQRAADYELSNPKNLNDRQKYEVKLSRMGIDGDDMREALDEFDTWGSLQKKKEVFDISQTLENEYKAKGDSLKIPEMPKQKSFDEAIKGFEPIISSLKGKEVFGIPMDDAMVKEFSNQSKGNLFDPGTTQEEYDSNYLETVFIVKNINKIIESARKSGYEEGYDEGAIFIKDQNSFSGSNRPVIQGGVETDSKKPDTGSLDYHRQNLEGILALKK